MCIHRTTLFASYLHRKTSAYCETTGTGGIREDDVAAYVAAIKRALAHYAVLPADHSPSAVPRLDVIDPVPSSWVETDPNASSTPASSGHMQVWNHVTTVCATAILPSRAFVASYVFSKHFQIMLH